MSITEAFKNAEVTRLRNITGSNPDGEPVYGDYTGQYKVEPEGMAVSISVEAASKTAAITAARDFYLSDPVLNPNAETAE